MDKINLSWLFGNYNTSYYVQKNAKESTKQYEEVSMGRQRIPEDEEMIYQVDSLIEDEKLSKLDMLWRYRIVLIINFHKIYLSSQEYDQRQ